MNAAALHTMQILPDIPLAYGVSDEFSFLLPRTCTLFDRRASKLVSTIVSTFTAAYVYLWPQHFPGEELGFPLPTFDGRAVLYPSERNVRDYFAWRQVDAHINNLYNTTFWALVQKGGRTEREAEEDLRGTFSKDKNEILFSRFGINYNNEEEIWRKGSVLVREYEKGEGERVREGEVTAEVKEESRTQRERREKTRRKAKVVVRHCDIIKDAFWEERPWVLG